MRLEGKGGGKKYLWYRCRRSSVHGSAVVVCSCKNWEKDNKRNGMNLGLFWYLFPSKFATYYQWAPQPNGVSESRSEQCLLHVGNLIEPYPISPNTTQRVGNGF